MEQKLRTLGVLYMIYGGLVLVYETGSLMLLERLSGVLGGVRGVPSWICPQFDRLFDLSSPLMTYVLFVIFIFSGLLILGGWGLYNRTNWGRITVLIMGILCLFRIPFGAALGIYTLYVVTKPEAARLTQS